MSGNKLHDLYRQWFAKGSTPEKAVDRFFRDLSVPHPAADLLRPVLIEDARRVKAIVSQQAANTVAGQLRSGDINPIEVRRALAKNEFALLDGTWVEWLKATPEQHEQRASALRQQVAGVLASVSLHERCAEVIREHGVSCLGEVPASARPEGVAA